MSNVTQQCIRAQRVAQLSIQSFSSMFSAISLRGLNTGGESATFSREIKSHYFEFLFNNHISILVSHFECLLEKGRKQTRAR